MKTKAIVLPILILIGILVGCSPAINCPVCEECPEEVAMLDLTLDNFYISEANEDRGFFVYWIVNYGKEQATDVVVECLMYDQNEKVVFRDTDIVGNIASGSSVYNELHTKNPGYSAKDHITSICAVKSCAGCEILTWRVSTYKTALNRFWDAPY